MDILITSAITAAGFANQIMHYCAQPNPSLAVGGGLPWLYAEVPIPVDINIIQLPDTLGYFPVKKIVPVVKSNAGLIVTAEDERWLELPKTLTALTENNCTSVYIEAEIVHNELPIKAQDYKSAGLYLNGTQPVSSKFTIEQPTGYLDIVQHFGVLPKVEDTTHVVQIIREF